MKIFGLLAILAIGCAAVADDISMNGEFDRIKDGMPIGWLQSTDQDGKPCGTVEMLQITEADGDIENAVRLVGLENQNDLYTEKLYPVRSGDLYEVEVKAKGTGQIVFGVYVCDAEGATVATLSEIREVTENFRDYTTELTIRDADQDGVISTAHNIRFFFGAAPDSDIVVEEIEADLED